MRQSALKDRSLVVGPLCIASAGLLIWSAAVILPADLGHQYVAHRWRTTWIVYDAAMAGAILATLVLYVRRRSAYVITSSAAAAMLLADAWFDCMTANRADLTMSLLNLVGELPGALALLALSISGLRAIPVVSDQPMISD